MKTRLLITLGGIIVGFWIFSIIFTQITLISIPSHTTVSGSTTISNEGKIIESFQVVPEVIILQITGFYKIRIKEKRIIPQNDLNTISAIIQTEILDLLPSNKPLLVLSFNYHKLSLC